MEVDGDRNKCASHSQTVQALRKYLQRKLSSEDSSSELESISSNTQSPPTGTYLKSEESTLTCSIVYPSVPGTLIPSQGSRVQKQRSLDLEDLRQEYEGTINYLRTDLCVPVLLSRCPFCPETFEGDGPLRGHIQESHFSHLQSQALDLSIKGRGQDALPPGSLPNLPSFGSRERGDSNASPITCATCGKSFSRKWNWKQHQKVHLRENLNFQA